MLASPQNHLAKCRGSRTPQNDHCDIAASLCPGEWKIPTSVIGALSDSNRYSNIRRLAQPANVDDGAITVEFLVEAHCWVRPLNDVHHSPCDDLSERKIIEGGKLCYQLVDVHCPSKWGVCHCMPRHQRLRRLDNEISFVQGLDVYQFANVCCLIRRCQICVITSDICCIRIYDPKIGKYRDDAVREERSLVTENNPTDIAALYHISRVIELVHQAFNACAASMVPVPIPGLTGAGLNP